MENDWLSTSLGEVVNFASGARNSQDAVTEGKYPFFLCSKEVSRHSEYDFDQEAVIMAGNNADAKFHLHYFKGKFAARQRTYIISPSRKGVSGRFLYYLLQALQPHFAARAQGTTTKFVTIGMLRSAPVNLPPPYVQSRIAHILGTLDDKIELNSRMNATLETMARALFQSWFVDFDPVRAKAAGQTPAGMDPATADLFPSELEDSAVGAIPKGWACGTVEDVCESISSGGTPSRRTAEFWTEGDIPWFKTGELHDGPLLDSEEFINSAALAGSSCKLWPRDTVLFALYASPTVGRLGVLTKPGTSNQAAAGLQAKPAFGTLFLVHLLLEAREKLQQIAVGAAQQNINQGVLKQHQVVLPPATLARRFSAVTKPLWDNREWLAANSRTLAALRDALLPKLLSGELVTQRASS